MSDSQGSFSGIAGHLLGGGWLPSLLAGLEKKSPPPLTARHTLASSGSKLLPQGRSLHNSPSSPTVQLYKYSEKLEVPEHF